MKKIRKIIIIILTAIIILFLLALSAATLYLLFFLKAGAESIQVSSLISIFAVIVSVWIGLNIYNILEKEKVEQACQIADEAIVKANELNKLSRSVTKAEIINALSRSVIYYTSSSFLLYEISEKDVVSDLNDKVLLKILEIENTFDAVGGAQRNKSIQDRCMLSEYGVKLCEELNILLSQTQTANIYFWEGYYFLRLADFTYYKNYRIYKNENAKGLDIAIDFYKKSLKSITTAILKTSKDFDFDEVSKNRKIDDEYKEQLLKFAAYIFNVVGESYNVRGQYPYEHCDNCMTEEQRELSAKNFLQVYKISIYLCNSDLSKLTLPFATYFRNFGTSLERIDININIDCCQLYLDALKINSLDILSHLNYAKYQLKDITSNIIKNNKRLELESSVKQNLKFKLDKDIKQHIDFLRYSDAQKIIGIKFGVWFNVLNAFISDRVEINKFRMEIEICREWNIAPVNLQDISTKNMEERCIEFLDFCYKEFGK